MIALLLLLLVVLLVLHFRRLHLARAPIMVRQWRDNGRQWAIYGEARRSEWCHECADWWDQPWWASLLTPLPRKAPATRV